MKKFLVSVVVVAILAACNNSSESGSSVGDSLAQDPQTGQPITTEPDTVGTYTTDSTQTNQNP